MQKLQKANLYRSKLIPISGKLVERYNKCLLKLGFTETTLLSFSIDGMGWSPEISEEKKDDYYLNNGEANSHAIIITPFQKGVPVYNPFHSYDKEIMRLIFKTHGNTIQNITRDSSICVDFDQKIDVFYEPLDVLKYKDVQISFRLIDDLDKAKEVQLNLIATFNKEHNFIDENIHRQLLASAKKHGDLRDRDLCLEPIAFTTDSFYTRAFGGIYLLRNFIAPILIFEHKEVYQEAIKDTSYDVLMFHISQPELIDQLKDHLIIESDLKNEVAQKRYERVKHSIFSEHLKDTQHSIKDILEDKILFKSYLNKTPIEIRKKVMSVERYLEKQQLNPATKIKDIVDQQFYFALHKPHSSLRPNHQDLIWNLLVKIAPKDILFLYWYDKEEFYKQFKTWNDSKKDWAIQTIKNNI
jgi:hypothetical protein